MFYQLSDALARILKKPLKTIMFKREIYNELANYLLSHNLVNKDNAIVFLDDDLQRLLGTTESLAFYTFGQLISPHLYEI